MRVHPGALVALLLVSTVMAGCFGSGSKGTDAADPLEVMNKEGLTASTAIEKAGPVAQAWREDAQLVGAQGEERSFNTTIAGQKGVGGAPPDDPVVGDGRAPVWLVGYRSGNAFLLVAVDGDGRASRVADGSDHPMAREQAVLGSWRTDSPAAMAAAKDQPAFAQVSKASDAILSMYLRPADPSLGTDPMTRVLAEHPHWVVYATSAMLSQVAIARIEATGGKYVDDGRGSEGEGKPAHEHAAFAIFIDGVQLSFDSTDYDLESIQYPKAHLRTTGTSGGSIIHLEGMFPQGEPDVTVAGFLSSLGITFSPGVMTLDKRSDHNGTLIADGNGKKWSVFASNRDDGRGPFELQWGDYSDIRLRDGLRLLITYSTPLEPDDRELARQQAAVPEPPQS